MSYWPINGMWILARAKLKGGRRYYGAYLGGFPERARALLGVTIGEPMLHVCGGMARHYPYRGGFGKHDATLDLDPHTKPDYLHDVRRPWPVGKGDYKAYLADPPYSEADAEHYRVGASNYPSPIQIIRNAFDVMALGQRVGIIHYMPPSPPRHARFVAVFGVMSGFNNRLRCYSVFEKR